MTDSRAKGKRGELAWRDFLREHGYADARRGQQFQGGPGSPDVVGGPVGTHVEVKNTERHEMWAAMEQSEREAAPGEMPYVACKRNGKRWLVVLRAEDLLRLIEEANDFKDFQIKEANQ